MVMVKPLLFRNKKEEKIELIVWRALHGCCDRDSGEPSKRRTYLPDDKQFLITRNGTCLFNLYLARTNADGILCSVPCRKRASQMEGALQLAEEDDSEDGWMATAATTSGRMEQRTLTEPVEEKMEASEVEFDTMEDEFDPAAADISSQVIPTRTYDLSITYDKYWQTPRMWLCGYDEVGLFASLRLRSKQKERKRGLISKF